MEKPDLFQPCNGCGICCKARVCYNGAYILGLVSRLGETVDGPCPAIVIQDGKTVCDIILHPKKYIKGSKYNEDVLRRNFMKAVGAGVGCDELGENPSEIEMSRMNEYEKRMTEDPEFKRKIKIVLKVLYGM